MQWALRTTRTMQMVRRHLVERLQPFIGYCATRVFLILLKWRDCDEHG